MTRGDVCFEAGGAVRIDQVLQELLRAVHGDSVWPGARFAVWHGSRPAAQPPP